jgi:hypothetical protein
MEIAKKVLLFLQIITAALTIFSYFGIKSESFPLISQFILIVPSWIYLFLFVIFLIIFFKKEERVGNIRIVAFAQDRQKVGEVNHAGVRWDIVAPKQSNYEHQTEYEQRLPNIADVNNPPKCPKCGVELEETKIFIFGKHWKCVGCGFGKWNNDSYYTESKRALRKWKGDYEAGTLTKK